MSSSSSTTFSSVWQNAWEEAQPQLSYIRDSLYSLSSPNPRIIRVGQLDSELLDQELAQILQEPIKKALALVNTSLKARFEPELALFIQTALYKLSIWKSGASYGAKLQDLKYVTPHIPNAILTPSGIPQRILLAHGALTLVLPYLHTRLRTYALSHAWPDAPSSDQRRKAWNLLTTLESSYSLLTLFSFISFLWDGRYRTIADRILNMTLVPSRRLVRRDVSYEFMNRQMVWHAFTEFLLFLLPLVNTRTVKRRLLRMISHIQDTTTNILSPLLPAATRSLLGSHHKHATKQKKRGKFWTLPKDQCAICAENASLNLNITESANAFSAGVINAQSTVEPPEETDGLEPPAYPITTPYLASCGDVYCYHCIAERMMHALEEDGDGGDGWECLRCGLSVREADRFVPEPDFGSESGNGSEYEFSSDIDATDMSGSVGSYTESERS